MVKIPMSMPKCCGKCKFHYTDYVGEVERCSLDKSIRHRYWVWNEKDRHPNFPLIECEENEK